MLNIFEIIPQETFEKYAPRIEEGLYKDKSLVLAVIDSIFSIGAKYESTINVVNRFVERLQLDPINEDYTTSEFIKDFGMLSGEELANDVFKNRLRTSTTNGILKAEAVKQVIKILNDFGIETKEDLLMYPHIRSVEAKVKTVKGQGSGVSFEYMMMHGGDETRFKPDRHIYKFFEEVLGSVRLIETALKVAFFKQLELVKARYPYFTARTLDSLIWEYMKYRE